VIAGGDDVSAEVEELFGDGWGEAEATCGVFSVDDEEIDGVGFKDVWEVFADDVAAGGTEDIADKKDIHWMSLHRVCVKIFSSFFHFGSIKPGRWGIDGLGVVVF
jgi:hypothetical protein